MSFISAFRSKIHKKIVVINEKQHNSKPTKEGKKKFFSISNKNGVKIVFKHDPKLKFAMLKPRAMAKSFFSNHFVTIVICATNNISPPIPKIILPKIINQYFALVNPIINVNYPKTSIELKIIKDFLIPILSIKIPPKNGKIMFGNE